MPFVARKQNKYGRRVGQAANGGVEFASNTTPVNVIHGSLFDAQRVSAQIAEEAADAVDQGDVADAGALVSLAADADGNQFLTAEFPQNGAQFAMQVPAAAAAEAAECEFPAQALALQRQINITNTTPQIVDVQTDICGNVVSYTENMTRNMVAGPWVPLSGLQGGVANLVVDPNQSISLASNSAVDFANAPGLSGLQAAGIPYTVVSEDRVGRARRAGKAVPNHNVNAAYGAAMMRKFRSA
jgi:hypothetical protein